MGPVMGRRRRVRLVVMGPGEMCMGVLLAVGFWFFGEGLEFMGLGMED